ncbi:unnamed protein product, partial [Discosporangium mesarthrocarpum]
MYKSRKVRSTKIPLAFTMHCRMCRGKMPQRFLQGIRGKGAGLTSAGSILALLCLCVPRSLGFTWTGRGALHACRCRPLNEGRAAVAASPCLNDVRLSLLRGEVHGWWRAGGKNRSVMLMMSSTSGTHEEAPGAPAWVEAWLDGEEEWEDRAREAGESKRASGCVGAGARDGALG